MTAAPTLTGSEPRVRLRGLARRRASLSDLVNRKAALSPEMALRIEKAFGVDMEMLLRIQAWQGAKAMRQRAGEIDVKRYERLPVPAYRRRPERAAF